MGLSADSSSLVLRLGDETFEVPLDEVRRAQPPPAARAGDGGPPSPREIQQRIRQGESAADIAASSGLPVSSVARYEGPVLAEREHQTRLARRAHVDGREVGQLVEDHMERVVPDAGDVGWDAWLTPTGAWEVRARSGDEVIRLSWDPSGRRVRPLDETARQALLLAPAAVDALGAVLRPLSTRVARTRPAAVPAAAAPRPAADRSARSAATEPPAVEPVDRPSRPAATALPVVEPAVDRPSRPAATALPVVDQPSRPAATTTPVADQASRPAATALPVVDQPPPPAATTTPVADQASHPATAPPIVEAAAVGSAAPQPGEVNPVSGRAGPTQDELALESPPAAPDRADPDRAVPSTVAADYGPALTVAPAPALSAPAAAAKIARSDGSGPGAPPPAPVGLPTVPVVTAEAPTARPAPVPPADVVATEAPAAAVRPLPPAATPAAPAGTAKPAPARPARPGGTRKARRAIPAWTDISTEVSGRRPEPPLLRESEG